MTPKQSKDFLSSFAAQQKPSFIDKILRKSRDLELIQRSLISCFALVEEAALCCRDVALLVKSHSEILKTVLKRLDDLEKNKSSLIKIKLADVVALDDLLPPDDKDVN